MSVTKRIIEFIVKKDKADRDIENLKNKTTEVSQEVQKTSADFGGLGDTIDSVSGGAVSSFKSLTGGVKGLTLGFKGLRGAIIATGIGALVVLLISAFEWFKNTEAGAKALDMALNVVGAVVGQLGKAFEALLEWDWDGVKNAFADIGSEIENAVDATNELYAAQEALFNLQSKNIVQNQKLLNVQRELVKTIEDTTISDERRIDAIGKLNKVNQKLLTNQQEELALRKQIAEANLATENNEEARRELSLEIQEIIAEELRLQGELAIINEEAEIKRREIQEATKREEEALAKERQARIENRIKLEEELLNETEKARIANIEDERERLEAEYQMNIKAIREKYGDGTQLEAELEIAKQARLDSIRDVEIEKEKARQEQIRSLIDGTSPDIELDEFGKLEKEKEEALAELELLNATTEQKLEVEANYLARRNKLEEDAANDEESRQKALRELEVDLAGQAIGAIAGLFEEGNKIGQGLAAASALMNTYQGITAALKDPTVPSTFVRIANAAIVGAQGFAAVKNILDTDSSGKNVTSSGRGGGNNVQGQSAPRFDLTTPDNVTLDEETGMTQVYVTSDEVTTQQELDRQRVANSRFF